MWFKVGLHRYSGGSRIFGGGGGASLERRGDLQVKWQSRLWVEIKKIGLACPK